MLSDKYFTCENGFLHDVMREDDKLSHAPVVTLVLSKYILHKAHAALGQNGTARI